MNIANQLTELDSLDVLVVVDNETDTLSSVAEGIPQIPEALQLAMRLPSVGVHDGHECKVVFDHLCCACHGLSVLLTGRRGTETHTVWFDVGPYPQMSACSHAGIVNACCAGEFSGRPDRSRARRLSPGRQDHGRADRRYGARSGRAHRAAHRRARSLHRLARQGSAGAGVCAGALRAECGRHFV